MPEATTFGLPLAMASSVTGCTTPLVSLARYTPTVRAAADNGDAPLQKHTSGAKK